MSYLCLWCVPRSLVHIVCVHNALSSASDTAPDVYDASSVSTLAAAFISSVSSPPPSPYYAVTGHQCDLTNVRTLFCECHVRVRNPDDIRRCENLRCFSPGLPFRVTPFVFYGFLPWNTVFRSRGKLVCPRDFDVARRKAQTATPLPLLRLAVYCTVIVNTDTFAYPAIK